LANKAKCSNTNTYLIANPKTQATWTHSYGNKLGWLAQGMPGQVKKGMDTIFFIPKDKVPRARTKDVTYGLSLV
jgi:hypothetical protein